MLVHKQLGYQVGFLFSFLGENLLNELSVFKLIYMYVGYLILRNKNYFLEHLIIKSHRNSLISNLSGIKRKRSKNNKW